MSDTTADSKSLQELVEEATAWKAIEPGQCPLCGLSAPARGPPATLAVERHDGQLFLCAIWPGHTARLAVFIGWESVDEYTRLIRLRDQALHEMGRMGL